MIGTMEPQTWVCLAATAAAWMLLGLSWTVQRAVYPAFLLVGPTSWPAYHAAHTRALAGAVGPPWLVQGVAALALPLVPGPVPWW
ncbi:MAG: hypothetical protein H7Y15_15155, partial [Pseudonocardia sp.]|nr:hypothetical protein [Pseudonocardia sp.]